MTFSFIPYRLPFKLGGAVVLLATLGFLVSLQEAHLLDLPGGGVMEHLFSLNREGTIPSWFSSCLLLSIAFFAFLVSRTELEHVRRFRGLWTLFAVLFVLLSMDETACLHERLQSILERHGGAYAHLVHFVWVIPALLFCAVLSLAYLRFVVSLEAGIRWRLILSGVIYVGGAAGMELIDGSILESMGDGVLYRLLTVMEESMEMSGAVLCLSTLCSLLALGAPGLFISPARSAAVAQVTP